MITFLLPRLAFNLSVNPIGSIFKSFRLQLPLVISTTTTLAPLDCARCFHLCLQIVSLNRAASVILGQHVSDFVTFLLKTLRMKVKVLIVTYRVLSDLALHHLSDLFSYYLPFTSSAPTTLAHCSVKILAMLLPQSLSTGYSL